MRSPVLGQGWGFVPGQASLEELVRTIESVAGGEVLVTPRVAAALFRRVATLAAGFEEPKPGLAHLPKTGSGRSCG